MNTKLPSYRTWPNAVALLVVLATVSAQPAKAQRQVQIPGMARAVNIQIPREFISASTSSEVQRRRQITQALANSPTGKGVVVDVYLTDWASSNILPLLYVGTLPSAVGMQGRIPADFWSELKEAYTKATYSKIPEIENYLPHSGTALKRLLAQTDPNSSLVFGFTPADEGKNIAPMLLARKIQYIRQSIVIFELAVDASASNATEALVDYLKDITVTSQ